MCEYVLSQCTGVLCRMLVSVRLCSTIWQCRRLSSSFRDMLAAARVDWAPQNFIFIAFAFDCAEYGPRVFVSSVKSEADQP